MSKSRQSLLCLLVTLLSLSLWPQRSLKPQQCKRPSVQHLKCWHSHCQWCLDIQKYQPAAAANRQQALQALCSLCSLFQSPHLRLLITITTVTLWTFSNWHMKRQTSVHSFSLMPFFWNCNLTRPLCSRRQYSAQHCLWLDDHHLTMANYLWYNWLAFLKDTEKSENAQQSNKCSDTCHCVRFLKTLRVFFSH